MGAVHTVEQRSAQPSGLRARLGEYLPILSWGRAYPRGWFGRDAIAGLTLWGLLVPEGMAYAGIADLPPEAGLYTLVVSLAVYALMGTARHLSVGPTSATAALLASSVTTAVIAAGGDSQDPGTYAASAAAFVLVTGLVFLVAGVLRLGFVTQFLSKPVMDGFVLGLAGFVAVGQLNKLFGVEKPEGNTVQRLLGIVRELPEANWTSFAIGAVSLVVLFGLPRVNPRLPAGLVVLFATIVVSAWLDLEGTHEVEVVGTLPQGLPSLTFTAVPLETYLAMVLPAIGVFLVAYSEALGVAHEFADKHGYEVDANQELNAHAATNVLSSLVGELLAAGNMSASAVKEGAGAQSQVANLVAWVATVITLLFFTPLFASLPEAVLGALIIHAVWHIIASRKLRTLRHESRTEFWFGLLAMLGVLLIDVLEGMVIGLVASLVFVVYQSSRPHLASVGRIPGAPGAYSDLERHPENTPVPGVLILRLNGALYYANALTVRDQVRALVDAADPLPHALVLDLGAQDTLDLTSAKLLIALGRQLRDEEVAAYLTDVHTPALAFARSVGVLDAIEDHVFPTIDLAVQHIERSPTSQSEINKRESAMTKVPWGREAMAGLAGAIGSVPDGMATAVLAGANPMAGLYASFAGPVAGGFLQSTTVMVVATTSAAAVTTAEVMNAGPADPIRTLATLTVLAGAFMLLATALGFARLMRFVSASVMAGFMFGVGLILILGQLADATGVKTSGDNTLEKALNTLRQWQSFDQASMLTAAAAIGISVLLGRGKLVALAPLIAIVVPTLVLRITGADVANVASASGPIEVGLPPLTLPDLGLLSPTLVASALALTIVVLVQAAGVGAAYPNEEGPAVDVRRDFVAQGGANLASGMVGGIPVGGSVGQTSFNVLAGGRTRWAVILSGLWMLLFVVALGPLLSEVPISALAGLLILAGFSSLKPRALARTWQTSKSSGAAAVITMVATLLVPIHVAVLIGVILSLLLVGINSASTTHVIALQPVAPGSWRRAEVPGSLPPGQVTVLDIEGPGDFASVPALFARLPQPPAHPPGEPDARQPMAVVLRLRGHLRTNLTFTKALEDYAEGVGQSGGTLIVCGLQPATITQLRSAGLPESIALLPQGDELEGSLTLAYDQAVTWLSAAG